MHWRHDFRHALFVSVSTLTNVTKDSEYYRPGSVLMILPYNVISETDFVIL